MENSNRFINISSNNSVELTNRKRGNIPYYTLSQVASLLNENEEQIRYYTNIFDDILKIEIADKQFQIVDKMVQMLMHLNHFT